MIRLVAVNGMFSVSMNCTLIGRSVHSQGPPPVWPTVTERHPVRRRRIWRLSTLAVVVVVDKAEAIDVLAGFREQLY